MRKLGALVGALTIIVTAACGTDPGEIDIVELAQADPALGEQLGQLVETPLPDEGEAIGRLLTAEMAQTLDDIIAVDAATFDQAHGRGWSEHVVLVGEVLGSLAAQCDGRDAGPGLVVLARAAGSDDEEPTCDAAVDSTYRWMLGRLLNDPNDNPLLEGSERSQQQFIDAFAALSERE